MGRHIVGASQRLAGRQIPSEFGSALKIKRRVGAIPQELQGVDSANKHISMLLKSKKNSQKNRRDGSCRFFVGFWCLSVLVMPHREGATCPVFPQCASVRSVEEGETITTLFYGVLIPFDSLIHLLRTLTVVAVFSNNKMHIYYQQSYEELVLS